MAAPNFVLSLTDRHIVQDAKLAAGGLVDLAQSLEDGNYCENDMQTPGLVDAYRYVKASEKAAKEIGEKMRDVILTRLDQGEANAKGIVTLVGGEPNAKIEARPRQTAKMDDLAMAALLNREGLLKEAVDTELTVTDAGKLYDFMADLGNHLHSLGQSGLAQRVADAMTGGFKKSEKLNEKKIEKLAKSGRLDADEAAACYAVSTNYALYDVTT